MYRFLSRLTSLIIAFSFLFLASCTNDDPTPSEEDKTPETSEPINFFYLEIWSETGLDPFTITYTDDNGDGVFDADWPLLELGAGYTYRFHLEGFRFQEGADIEWAPIQQRSDDHIVCFEVTNSVVAPDGYPEYDYDSNDLPTGLGSFWTGSSVAKTGTLKMTLRHQPGIKTGDCPGEGEMVDMEIVIPIKTVL